MISHFPRRYNLFFFLFCRLFPGGEAQILHKHEGGGEDLVSLAEGKGHGRHITGGDVNEAIERGVRRAYRDGCFRASVLTPLTRVNTKDNTPAIVHMRIVPGETVTLTAAPKGFGSENMSRLWMLTPAQGIEGVKDCIVETVRLAGGNPCPPVVVGVGIGGTLELAGLCAKRAAMRDVDTRNPDPRYAAFEEELLGLLNDLGTGPQGLGGTTTAFKVNVEFCATHIASLPVAVNINCHAARHAEAEL